MPPRPSITQFLPSQNTGTAQSEGQVSTKGDVYETLELELGAQHSIKRRCYHHYHHFPDNNQQTFCKRKTVGMEAAVPRNDSKGVSNTDQIHSSSPGYLLCFVLLCWFLPESGVKAPPTWMCHSSTQPPGTSVSLHKPSHSLPAYSWCCFWFPIGGYPGVPKREYGFCSIEK